MSLDFKFFHFPHKMSTNSWNVNSCDTFTATIEIQYMRIKKTKLSITTSEISSEQWNFTDFKTVTFQIFILKLLTARNFWDQKFHCDGVFIEIFSYLYRFCFFHQPNQETKTERNRYQKKNSHSWQCLSLQRIKIFHITYIFIYICYVYEQRTTNNSLDLDRWGSKSWRKCKWQKMRATEA